MKLTFYLFDETVTEFDQAVTPKKIEGDDQFQEIAGRQPSVLQYGEPAPLQTGDRTYGIQRQDRGDSLRTAGREQ